MSGPPPAAACSAWTDIAARACRSRSRSRSRSTLKDQCFLRLFHYKRLYSATIDFISKYKSIDIFLLKKNEKRVSRGGREKEQNFHGFLLPESRSIMKVQYFLRLFHYKRLYFVTIDFISKYKSIDFSLSEKMKRGCQEEEEKRNKISKYKSIDNFLSKKMKRGKIKRRKRKGTKFPWISFARESIDNESPIFPSVINDYIPRQSISYQNTNRSISLYRKK